MMLSTIEKKLINFFYKLEMHRKFNKEINKYQNNILPNYILKRHIKIISNGEVIFDSNDYKDKHIPLSIQYTIRQYGYPDTIKSTNKTPLIYNITSVASSIFSSEEEQDRCLAKLKKM